MASNAGHVVAAPPQEAGRWALDRLLARKTDEIALPNCGLTNGQNDREDSFFFPVRAIELGTPSLVAAGH